MSRRAAASWSSVQRNLSPLAPSQLNPLLPSLVPEVSYEYDLMQLSDREWLDYLISLSMREGGPLRSGDEALDKFDAMMTAKFGGSSGK